MHERRRNSYRPRNMHGKTVLALNPSFKFKNFTVVPENRMAYKACMEMVNVKYPGHPALPLLIYGGSGTGKTHLVQAVANELRRRRPGANVEYFTCERLVRHYVDAITKRRLRIFREGFGNLAFLLVDDIDFLSKTGSLQKEFLDTFENSCKGKTRIILTSAKHPSKMKGPMTSLRSARVVGIRPFGEKSKLAIIRRKQQGQHVKLDSDILSIIARMRGTDIRRLEGALNLLRVHAVMDGRGKTIDIKTARNLLKK